MQITRGGAPAAPRVSCFGDLAGDVVVEHVLVALAHSSSSLTPFADVPFNRVQDTLGGLSRRCILVGNYRAYTAAFSLWNVSARS